MVVQWVLVEGIFCPGFDLYDCMDLTEDGLCKSNDDVSMCQCGMDTGIDLLLVVDRTSAIPADSDMFKYWMNEIVVNALSSTSRVALVQWSDTVERSVWLADSQDMTNEEQAELLSAKFDDFQSRR